MPNKWVQSKVLVNMHHYSTGCMHWNETLWRSKYIEQSANFIYSNRAFIASHGDTPLNYYDTSFQNIFTVFDLPDTVNWFSCHPQIESLALLKHIFHSRLYASNRTLQPEIVKIFSKDSIWPLLFMDYTVIHQNILRTAKFHNN